MIYQLFNKIKLKKYFRKYNYETSFWSLMINPFFIMRNLIYAFVKANENLFEGRILDVGCGSKPYEHFMRNAQEYIGLDTWNSGHNHSSSRVDVFYDGRVFPFDDEVFDVVTAFEVLEHVEDIEFFLSEVDRVLKDGGYFIGTIPFLFPEHEMPFDFRRYTSIGMSNVFEKNGFQVMQINKLGNSITFLGQIFIDLCFRQVFTKRKIFLMAILSPILLILNSGFFLLSQLRLFRQDYFLGLTFIVRR